MKKWIEMLQNNMSRDLHTHLSILARTVQHKNLSLAANHVGLSQSQLSRIIAKLEDELNVILLDRGVRRKSSWTPVARRLSELYLKSEHELNSSIQEIIEKPMFATLKMGTLEGLSQIALDYCEKLFQHSALNEIHLDIYEISDLEEKFESSELDIIFSFRAPSMQKYKNVIELGFQSVDPIRKDDKYLVYSPYEFIKRTTEEKNLSIKNSKSKNKSEKLQLKKNSKIFISNSINIRKYWIENIGGSGKLPSIVIKSPKEGTKPVYLVGSDLLSPLIWKEIIK